MEVAQRHVAQGYIAVVQEQRFRLVTDSGQGLLLTLAHNAPLDLNDLQRLHETKTHVNVEYEGDPNLENGVALAVNATGAHH